MQKPDDPNAFISELLANGNAEYQSIAQLNCILGYIVTYSTFCYRSPMNNPGRMAADRNLFLATIAFANWVDISEITQLKKLGSSLMQASVRIAIPV